MHPKLAIFCSPLEIPLLRALGPSAPPHLLPSLGSPGGPCHTEPPPLTLAPGLAEGQFLRPKSGRETGGPKGEAQQWGFTFWSASFAAVFRPPK